MQKHTYRQMLVIPTLDKHCDFIRIEVGALSSMFMSILLY